MCKIKQGEKIWKKKTHTVQAIRRSGENVKGKSFEGILAFEDFIKKAQLIIAPDASIFKFSEYNYEVGVDEYDKDVVDSAVGPYQEEWEEYYGKRFKNLM